ncbi:helix-turn-helix domain-containing protein [Robiginitalea sp. IMCC44478]|uniref:helix-turn-helix domain-containing protein n=1 Tax=Robiginitalea sp. IMCC44478 TaxID=3459122 RepID=UPI004043229E
MKVKIKNMVCERCRKVLYQELQRAGIKVISLELGELVVPDEVSADAGIIREIIERNGFEIIDDQTTILVEKVKSLLIRKVEDQDLNKEKISEYLSGELHTDYSIISKSFSLSTGMTIEKYLLRLKVEKAKELLQMDRQSFSEIAYTLGFSAGSHLAKQFKSITGMSMTEYKKLQQWNRKNYDKIL